MTACEADAEQCWWGSRESGRSLGAPVIPTPPHPVHEVCRAGRHLCQPGVCFWKLILPALRKSPPSVSWSSPPHPRLPEGRPHATCEGHCCGAGAGSHLPRSENVSTWGGGGGQESARLHGAAIPCWGHPRVGSDGPSSGPLGDSQPTNHVGWGAATGGTRALPGPLCSIHLGHRQFSVTLATFRVPSICGQWHLPTLSVHTPLDSMSPGQACLLLRHWLLGLRQAARSGFRYWVLCLVVTTYCLKLSNKSVTSEAETIWVVRLSHSE